MHENYHATAQIPEHPRLPPEPRKRPKQSRSRILVESLNEACLRIARRERELSMTEIAAVAGVAMGSIYQYFSSLEAVIASAFEQAILEEIDLIRRKGRTEWRELHVNEALVHLVVATMEFHSRLHTLDCQMGRRYYASYDIEAWLMRLTEGLQAETGAVHSILERVYLRLNRQTLQIHARVIALSLHRRMIEIIRRKPTRLGSPELEHEMHQVCRALVMRAGSHETIAMPRNSSPRIGVPECT